MNRIKTIAVVSFAAACVAGPAAPAAEVPRTVRSIQWSDLQRQGKLPGGLILPAGETAEFESLRLEVAEPGKTVALVTIENPGVDTAKFAVQGTIRYDDIEGAGYVELWVRFADGQRFYTRTLADTGPLAAITGTSDWRMFSLPFDSLGRPDFPTRLEVNLVLPQGGTVQLSGLRVVTLRDDPRIPDPNAGLHWWSDRAGGWVGGLGGTLLGLLCAAVAVLAVRGVGRLTVLSLLIAMATVGVGGLTAGIVAACVGQPYGVFFPLLLGGVLYALAGGLGLLLYPRVYQNIELRKMSAQDA